MPVNPRVTPIRNLSAMMLGKQPRLAAGLFAAGILAIAAAVGVGASSAIQLPGTVLLIAGCELVIAGMVVSAKRVAVPALSLETFLANSLAEAVFGLAFVCTVVIVLFGQSKSTERLGYALAAVVVVPASLVLAWRRNRAPDGESRGPSGAVVTLAVTAAVLCTAKLVISSHISLALLIGLPGGRIAAALGLRHAGRQEKRTPRPPSVAIIPVLLVIAAVPFVPAATLNFANIAIAAICCAAIVALRALVRGRPQPARRVVDVAAVSVCTLLVFVLGHPALVGALNQIYYLGPTTDVLHGHPVLVSTFSQYGFGMFDVLAAFFSVVPIGYGTFTLLLSALTACLFAAVYVVLRLATNSQLVAIAGLAVAVAVNIFGTLLYYTYFPSTGVLRFGLAWLVILLSVGASRSAGHKRLLDLLVLVVVGAAAAWSGETGVYCLGAACAIACVDAATLDSEPGVRFGAAIRGVARLLAASICGVLVFTGLTRAATGVWPHWSSYLEFIRLYTTGGFGALPIAAWSPGLAVGALYVASTVTLVALVALRPALVRERHAAFRAIAGLTAMGSLVFTYYLGRAAPTNLIHISPPAVALLFVWAGIANATLTSRRTATIAIAAAMFLGALAIAGERGNVASKYPRTALAALLGRSVSVTTQLRSMWHNPVVDPEAAHVARFVSSLGRSHTPLIVLLYPSVASEALLRLDRGNAVGTSNPCQESFSDAASSRVEAGVRALRTGAVLVTSAAPADAGRLLPIQRYTLALIRARFTMRQIGADGRGLKAFVLAAPAPATGVGAGVPAAPGPTLPRFGCA
jgi:hypothetical protein